MWVESAVLVSEHPVGLNVERLDGERHERAAALLAWFTLASLSNDGPDAMSAWHDYIAEIVREHVSFVIAEPYPEELDSSWWTEALGCAFIEFIRHNELAPSINRHLETLRRAGQRRVES